MANKWIRKLGMGMSVIMTVSQLSTSMALAAPEEDNNDEFTDILAEKYSSDSDSIEINDDNDPELQYEFYDEDIYTANDIIAAGSCKDHIAWELDSSGTLSITGYGTFKNGFITEYGQFNSSDVKHVIIGEGISNIPEAIFKDYKELVSVQLPNTVTSIGNDAFLSCYSLETINLPDSITEIGERAFVECKSLTSIELPSNLTVISNSLFSHCYNLKNVKIPKKITTIDTAAFWQCKSLESIDIPNSVESIGMSAFALCSSIKTIKVPNGISVIAPSTFSLCTSLLEIDLPKTITRIEDNAFAENRKLTTVNFHGTTEEWKNIRIGLANERLKEATVNYVSSPIIAGAALVYDAENNVYNYVVDGEIDYDTYGFIYYQGYKFIVANGKLSEIDGLVQDPNSDKWYYCSKGQVVKYTGLVEYDGEWFYVNSGLLDTTLDAIIMYDNGKFFVGAGRIIREVSGLAQDPNGSDWYYFANGQAQTQYTGLAQYDGQWFYIQSGKLASDFTGSVKYDGSIFWVENGMVK